MEINNNNKYTLSIIHENTINRITSCIIVLRFVVCIFKHTGCSFIIIFTGIRSGNVLNRFQQKIPFFSYYERMKLNYIQISICASEVLLSDVFQQIKCRPLTGLVIVLFFSIVGCYFSF